MLEKPGGQFFHDLCFYHKPKSDVTRRCVFFPSIHPIEDAAHEVASVVNHGDGKCRKDRVVGPLSFMNILWLINGGLLDLLATYAACWDDPPRNHLVFL